MNELYAGREAAGVDDHRRRIAAGRAQVSDGQGERASERAGQG